MAWGTFLINLEPGTACISRVMVARYFLVVSKFVVATRKCCRMQVGNNNSYCRGILVLRRCKTTQTVAKNIWKSILGQDRARPAGLSSRLCSTVRTTQCDWYFANFTVHATLLHINRIFMDYPPPLWTIPPLLSTRFLERKNRNCQMC